MLTVLLSTLAAQVSLHILGCIFATWSHVILAPKRPQPATGGMSTEAAAFLLAGLLQVPPQLGHSQTILNKIGISATQTQNPSLLLHSPNYCLQSCYKIKTPIKRKYDKTQKLSKSWTKEAAGDQCTATRAPHMAQHQRSYTSVCLTVRASFKSSNSIFACGIWAENPVLSIASQGKVSHTVQAKETSTLYLKAQGCHTCEGK